MSVTLSVGPLQQQSQSLASDALSSDAAGRPRLIGGACQSCGTRAFPFAPICSNCMSEEMQREPMSNQGTLYAYTIVHVGPKAWEKPYAIGYVDLDNGVRVFSHLRGAVAIGQAIEIAVAEIGKNAAGAPITTFVFQPREA
jgi:uncharacterized OB-fold protein